ncbi:MAG TPA: Rieske (2Fe-2S) protein [Desulfuromonadaceae bacterium]
MAGIAGLFLAGRFLTPRMAKKKEKIVLPKAEIPEHGALVYREARLAVIREKGELYALDLVCTHLGCTLAVTPSGLTCPCHGSRFDREGNVLKGPADRPLKRYAVQVDRDGISVSLT